MMINRRSAALQLFLFLFAFFVLWTLRATVFMPIDESITSRTLRVAYSDFLKFVLWVLPAMAFAHYLRNEPPTRYLGLSVMPTLHIWSLCLAATFLFLSAVTVIDLASGRKTLSVANLSSLPGIQLVLQYVLSPLLEEILFRGLVMKEFLTLLSHESHPMLCEGLPTSHPSPPGLPTQHTPVERGSPDPALFPPGLLTPKHVAAKRFAGAPAILANLITSILFVGAHLPYWLTHGGLNQAVITNQFGVFVFSLIAGWLYAKSNSIWPPTVAHIANNVLTAMLNASNS